MQRIRASAFLGVVGIAFGCGNDPLEAEDPLATVAGGLSACPAPSPPGQAASPPLRDISPTAPIAYEGKRTKKRGMPPLRHLGPQEDSAIQGSVQGLAPAPNGPGFEGLGLGLPGFGLFGVYIPPDTNGAVGHTFTAADGRSHKYFVQMVNSELAVFELDANGGGTLVYGPVIIEQLFNQGAFKETGNPCALHNDGDPIVKYDHAARRWIISQFVHTYADPANRMHECVAVSQTEDPLGAYHLYQFPYGREMPDYPKFGIWPDAYYVTFNVFLDGGTFTGAGVCAYDRAAMVQGLPARQQCFSTGSAYHSLLPADWDGEQPPPADAPNYLVALRSSSSLGLWKFKVDWNDCTRSSFTGPTAVTVAGFTRMCGGGVCVAQPQDARGVKLDPLSDRLMYRLAYRNFGTHESLVVNHSVNASRSSGGIRWYELRDPGGTPKVHQQGTYSPTGDWRFMGSIAMDQDGNIAVGYSISGKNIHPGIRYAGRLAGDKLGTLQAEQVLVAGGGSQTVSRWGDYSSMEVDPDDDCTFWYTNQYQATTGSWNWHTRIGSFKFPSCGAN